MQSDLLLGDLGDQMYHCIHLVEIPQWESGRDRKHPWRTIQHLEQLRSHPRGIIHFRYYDVTSCDVTFGHVTSDSHATFGHEQWYILYYYCIKKKSRGIHFRGCAEDTSGNDVTSGHMTSCDLIPVRAASGDVTSSNACVMARSPLLPLNYALCYPDILLWYLDLRGTPYK